MSLREQSRRHLQKEQRKDRATPIYSVGEELPQADHCQLAVLLHLQGPRELIHSFWTCKSHNNSSILCTLQYSARLTVWLIRLQVAKQAPMPSSEGPFPAPRDDFASLTTAARASRAACCSSASFFHTSSGCLALARICFELYLSKNPLPSNAQVMYGSILPPLVMVSMQCSGRRCKVSSKIRMLQALLSLHQYLMPSDDGYPPSEIKDDAYLDGLECQRLTTASSAELP